MPALKSPGGSLFPYYYKNGEIFGVHYGSFFDHEEGLLSLMNAEEAFMKGQNCQLPLWIDFYETKLTDRILIEFLQSMDRLHHQIPKLAIVGCAWKDQWRIKQLRKKLDLELPALVKYFSDPEEAKTWLVSENY
jgi:hypothetical protein